MNRGTLKYPSVSIILPTYNRAHILYRSKKGVLKQTYKRFEFIVIDDIPKGNTEEIISNIGVKIL